MRHSFKILAIAFLTAAASTGAASAHAHLKSSKPAAGATVARPTEIDLGFSEGVNLKFTGVVVSGPGGAGVPTGPARFGAGGDATVEVPFAAQLAPGTYEVQWHVLAVDGHKTEGSFPFTVMP